jgi:hypothetical protein
MATIQRKRDTKTEDNLYGHSIYYTPFVESKSTSGWESGASTGESSASNIILAGATVLSVKALRNKRARGK